MTNSAQLFRINNERIPLAGNKKADQKMPKTRGELCESRQSQQRENSAKSRTKTKQASDTPTGTIANSENCGM